jgi:Flp pilus assembly protein TadG
MNSPQQRQQIRRRCQRAPARGAAAVEFALVSLFFFTMLIGAMEMARLLYYWNSAAEVTRLGARLAVVCDLNDADIKARMRGLLPLLTDATITVAYAPGGCDVNTCQSATVSISATTPIETYIPFVPLSVLMPAFTTSLPRESMQSTFAGVNNPVCQ